MNIPLFNGQVKQGKFSLDNKEQFTSWVHSLSDGAYQMRISKPKKIRSQNQNNYLHGVLIEILSKELGYEFAEMKGIIKWRFNVKHTSELSTAESEILYEEIRRWALKDLNIILPMPDEIYTV